MKKTHVALAAALLLLGGAALAHWCSNIFGAHARLVVKPEKTSIVVGSTPTTLNVYLQNNFPYKLFNVEMRGNTTAYTVSVSPASQTVSPGQQVLYTFTISGSSGTVPVSQLALQVRIRIGGWQGESDPFVDPSPSQADLIAGSVYGSALGDQTPSFNAATLADLYPAATIPALLNRSGLKQLIHWYAYRWCYNTSGNYKCGSQECPSPCDPISSSSDYWTSIEQFPQNCMRAGVDVGIRKAKLGSLLQYARDGSVYAMQGGSAEHKCLAAVVGGHLWNGASSTTTFENALNNVSAACKAAGLRALGKSSTPAACTSGAYYEKAACAAAEGLRGNDGPVKSVLIPSAGDGDSCGAYSCLYYAYMLYLAAGDRWAQGQAPSFYPTVGPSPTQDSGTPPPPADQGVPPPPKDQGVPPPPTDQGVPPPTDQGVTPPADQGGTASDGPGPGGDATGSPETGLPLGDGGGLGLSRVLEGGCGCSVSRAPREVSALWLALGLLLGLSAVRGRGRSSARSRR